jgi:hypothetical protein
MNVPNQPLQQTCNSLFRFYCFANQKRNILQIDTLYSLISVTL